MSDLAAKHGISSRTSMGGNMLELAHKEVEKDKKAAAAANAAPEKAKPTDVMKTHVKAPRTTPTEKAGRLSVLMLP